jgi:hypothetical protein
MSLDAVETPRPRRKYTPRNRTTLAPDPIRALTGQMCAFLIALSRGRPAGRVRHGIRMPDGQVFSYSCGAALERRGFVHDRKALMPTQGGYLFAAALLALEHQAERET